MQFGRKVGLNPNDAAQRRVLLNFTQPAAVELFQISDMAGSLEEQYFKINANQTVSLPEYVGQVRAMREADTQIAMSLSQMRPRYNQFNWQYEWRNWRVKGLQCLQTSVINQSAAVLTVKAVETPPIVVTLVGPTEGSASTSESITMDSLSKNSTNAFLDYTSITKDRVNNYDVLVSDVDGVQLSVITNTKIKALFQILDVSTAPWIPPSTSPQLGWIEVLYKKSLAWLTNDSDEFPAPGYDDVWVDKCLQLFYEEQNNPTIALTYYQKAMTMLAQIHEDANRGTDDLVAMVENPHDTLWPRTGFGRDYRWAYRISGR